MGLGISLVLIVAGALVLGAFDTSVAGLDTATLGVVLVILGFVGVLLSFMFWASWDDGVGGRDEKRVTRRRG